MLYYLAQAIVRQADGTEWENSVSFLRLFNYLTFRGAGAAATALLLSLWLGPRFIAWLRRLKFSQMYKDKAEESGVQHMSPDDKRGVPTMGGLMIVMVMDFTTLLWAQWNTMVQLTLMSAVVMCGLGFYDDYAKITMQSNKGVKANFKLWVQGLMAVFIAVYLYKLPSTSHLISEVLVPFYKYPLLTGGLAVGAGILITVFAIVGSSNAVNLTDGLDGLAIGCTVIVSFVFLIVTYAAGRVDFSHYLQITHVPGAGELTVFMAAMIGAGLGFLWFNCYPAQVFMGDTGSLALGGVLGMVAVLVHQPFLLVIAGGVFVMEALSVLLQTTWFKYTRARYGEGRRIFLMAPLHHHFQKLGWRETQVVTRFYILCVLFAVLALSTLKIR
jgi:phospho-N-acetylmuramoyl-pentapeptide-transferase